MRPSGLVLRSEGCAPRDPASCGPTTIEGEWDEVMSVIKAACDAVAATSPRVSLVIKADLRAGYTGQLAEKVTRIDEELG